MTKRTAIIGVMAAAAISITACGSNGNEGTPTNPVAPTAQQATPAAGTGAPQAQAHPNLLTKQLGEQAGLGTPTNPVLTVTIQDATTSTTCDGLYGATTTAPDGSEYLTVTVNITTSSSFPEANRSILTTDHWSAIDSTGTQHRDITTDAKNCDSNTADLIVIEPDTNITEAMTFLVPEGTTSIAIEPEGQQGGWAWDIS